jgi:hypothetical protein
MLRGRLSRERLFAPMPVEKFAAEAAPAKSRATARYAHHGRFFGALR